MDTASFKTKVANTTMISYILLTQDSAQRPSPPIAQLSTLTRQATPKLKVDSPEFIPTSSMDTQNHYEQEYYPDEYQYQGYQGYICLNKDNKRCTLATISMNKTSNQIHIFSECRI
jgi:hypothetical protein